ncbi:MAG: hypothetical protein JW741_04000 [Sedimentisphaerales bacterium]|nr:hypothetical protein [Sedimentisphaerales bacterium]
MQTRTWLFVTLIVCALTGAAAAARVACVGDSITYGSGISDRMHDSYPAQLQRLLLQYDRDWEVSNFGVSGATLLHRGDKPYIQQSAYNSATAYEPDIVIIKLGTNDSKPQNWQYKEDFVADYSAMIDVFRSLPSQPQVWICRPVPAFQITWGISPEIIRDEILPLVEQVALENEVPVIDLYTALLGEGHFFPDNIHPNAEGAGVMAEVIGSHLLGVRFPPDFNGDWRVDIEDLVVFIEHWGQEEPLLDLAPVPFGDGVVDVNDLAALMRYWERELYDPKLLAHWQLDETAGTIAHDRMGQYDATFTGDPLWRPEGGRIAGAILLDGLNDALLADLELGPRHGYLSVWVWVKDGAPGQVIISQAGGPNLLMNDPQEGFLMTEFGSAGRAGGPLRSDTVITDGDWHRVGLVWDGTNRTIYADDVAVAESSRVGFAESRGGLNIGCDTNMTPGTFFSGLIDEIRIYTRVVMP